MIQTSTSVFISYSTEDAAFANRIKTDLQARGFNTWIDKIGITPGTRDWEEELRDSMRRSQAILFIASPHSRRSHYVKDELRLADIYNLLIIPVWADGVDWIDCVPMGWGSIQYSDARADRYPLALEEVTAKLRGISSPINTPTNEYFPTKPMPIAQPSGQQASSVPEWEPRNPFKGLRAFTAADRVDFFGRDSLIEELTTSLRETLAAGNRDGSSARLLTVIGPSGSGKSSVVMAGLLPRLHAGALDGSSQWVYLDPIVPGAHPIEALMVALSNQMPEKTLRGIRKDLEDDDARGLHLLATTLAKNSDKHVVLVIDQFEELFTLTEDERERQQFIDLLVTAVTTPRGRMVVLLTLRADFYDRPMRYPDLYRLLQRYQHPILPMTIEDLRSVIEKPAALPGVRLTFEGPLVGDLLYEMQGQVGALPLLEFTLDQLFQRRDEHTLTLAAYKEIGGVRGALTKHAEATYAGLASDYHRQMARVLFLRLIDPGISEQDATRRRAAMQELTLPDPTQTRILHEVTEAFIAAHLLTTNETVGTRTIEVSHEALIREWARLADWLRDGRDDLRIGLRISADTRLWLQRAKPVDLLYRGDILREAQEWVQRGAPNTDEVEFIQAGEAEEKRLEMAEQSRLMSEIKLQKRAIRSTRLLYAAFGLLMIVAIVFAGVEYQSNASLTREAQQLQRANAQLKSSIPASVTSTADDGSSGTLRIAIANAPDGGTVTLSPTLNGKTIELTDAITINRDIFISVPKGVNVTIRGGGSDRAFEISSANIVTISNVTITGGNTPDSGGGILIDGQTTVNLVDVTLNGNTAGSNGGAIESDGGANINLINCNVVDNTATNGGAVGITTGGSANFTNTSIANNSASGLGGGVYNEYGSLSVSSSKFTDNSAGSLGGGVYNDYGYLSVSSSTFTGNSAGSSSATKSGKDVFNADAGYTYTDDSSTVTNIVCTDQDNKILATCQ